MPDCDGVEMFSLFSATMRQTPLAFDVLRLHFKTKLTALRVEQGFFLFVGDGKYSEETSSSLIASSVSESEQSHAYTSFWDVLTDEHSPNYWCNIQSCLFLSVEGYKIFCLLHLTKCPVHWLYRKRC